VKTSNFTTYKPWQWGTEWTRAKNHGASGLCPLSMILNIWKTIFSKLDLFPSSCEGKEISTPLGLLEGTSFNHWIKERRFPLLTWRRKQIRF
jgi:hypothetical protein